MAIAPLITIGATISWWPLVVLGIALAVIVVLITVLKVHPFMALIAAAILTGGIADRLPQSEGSAKPHWVQAVELTVDGFGKTAGKIGIVIALAAVIGVCLVESGAADRVVRRLLALLGEKRAGHALFAGGYVLSIPIFFETYFMLLLPLAQAMAVRTGRNYMLYVLAICCGGTMTHSLVAPHPGPLAMADTLKLDVGLTILCGIAAGLIPATVAWLVAQRISRRVNAPLRQDSGADIEGLRAQCEKPDAELPSLGASLFPVLLPLVLIGAVSMCKMTGAAAAWPRIMPWLEFAGERHIALLLGALSAMALLMRQRRIGLSEVNRLAAPTFATAAVIVLIAAAGGAFGGMLRHAGVGDVMGDLAGKWHLNLVLLSWAVSALIRVAQGSATVAMITASAIMAPLVTAGLPYHPIFIFLAIGFGSKMCSWMNDSGFWTVSKLSGFTERETLQSWTVLVSVESLTGLALCLIASSI